MKNVMMTKTASGAGRLNRLCALALAGLLGLAPLAATAEITGNIGAASNYVFRGISLTGNEAQVSGGLDYSHDSGFYVGTWISNLDSSYEVDVYGGYSGEYSDIGYDVGYLRYTYPGLNNSDYGEIYGSLSYKWFTAGVAYTVDSQVNDTPASAELFLPGDVYYYLSANFDLGNDWSAGGTVGYYDFDEDGVGGADASYMHAQVGLTKSAGDFGDFSISVSYADDAPASGGTGDLLPFVSWSKSF